MMQDHARPRLMSETAPVMYAPGGLTLRPFSPTDPRRIVARADFALEHALSGEPLFGPGRPDGPCWTLTEGAGKWDQVLACGGFEPRGPGHYAAWLYAGDLSPRAWVMVARAFARMRCETGARRVEATIRHASGGELSRGVERAEAYARRVGMRLEGLMKSFGPDGADYWLYAGVY